MPQWRSTSPMLGDLPEQVSLPADAGRILLGIARSVISTDLGVPVACDESAAWLREEGACFVTLAVHGELAGCIGTITPYRALRDDVRGNARSAAFHDRRFSPLRREHLDDTVIEVSVLSPLVPLEMASENDAVAMLRPGIDGVVLEYADRRATFLPQVWTKLPGPRDFLAHLRRKLGVPDAFWSEELRLYRYTVRLFSEEDRP